MKFFFSKQSLKMSLMEENKNVRIQKQDSDCSNATCRVGRTNKQENYRS